MSRKLSEAQIEKAHKAVKEHILENMSVSELAEKYGCTPQTIYNWINKFLEEVIGGFVAAGDLKSLESIPDRHKKKYGEIIEKAIQSLNAQGETAKQGEIDSVLSNQDKMTQTEAIVTNPKESKQMLDDMGKSEDSGLTKALKIANFLCTKGDTFNLKKIIEKYPENPEMILIKIRMLRNLGQIDKILKICEEHPDILKIQISAINIFIDCGMLDKATERINMYPDNKEIKKLKRKVDGLRIIDAQEKSKEKPTTSTIYKTDPELDKVEKFGKKREENQAIIRMISLIKYYDCFNPPKKMLDELYDQKEISFFEQTVFLLAMYKKYGLDKNVNPLLKQARKSVGNMLTKEELTMIEIFSQRMQRQRGKNLDFGFLALMLNGYIDNNIILKEDEKIREQQAEAERLKKEQEEVERLKRQAEAERLRQQAEAKLASKQQEMQETIMQIEVSEGEKASRQKPMQTIIPEKSGVIPREDSAPDVQGDIASVDICFDRKKDLPSNHKGAISPNKKERTNSNIAGYYGKISESLIRTIQEETMEAVIPIRSARNNKAQEKSETLIDTIRVCISLLNGEVSDPIVRQLCISFLDDKIFRYSRLTRYLKPLQLKPLEKDNEKTAEYYDEKLLELKEVIVNTGKREIDTLISGRNKEEENAIRVLFKWGNNYFFDMMTRYAKYACDENVDPTTRKIFADFLGEQFRAFSLVDEENEKTDKTKSPYLYYEVSKPISYYEKKVNEVKQKINALIQDESYRAKNKIGNIKGYELKVLFGWNRMNVIEKMDECLNSLKSDNSDSTIKQRQKDYLDSVFKRYLELDERTQPEGESFDYRLTDYI